MNFRVDTRLHTPSTAMLIRYSAKDLHAELKAGGINEGIDSYTHGQYRANFPNVTFFALGEPVQRRAGSLLRKPGTRRIVFDLASAQIEDIFFIIRSSVEERMDEGKIFVLILTAAAIGILGFLELKSRRSRRE